MDFSELNKIANQYRNIKFDKVFIPEEMYDGYMDYSQNIQGRKVKLGFGKLDEALGFIRPSQVVTVIGGTNIGKTSLAMNVALVNAESHKDRLIIFFNLEIDENEIFERLIQMKFNLNSFEVEQAFLKKTEQLKEFKILAEDTRNFVSVIGRVNVDDIIPYVKACEYKYNKPAGFIVVDYLGLILNIRHKDEYSRITDTMQKLKEIALHLRLPILNLSQTSRLDIKNTDKKLGLHSGKSSGEVENSSQIVITIDKLLSEEEMMKDNVPLSFIQDAKEEKIYILKATIQKKKQGRYGDTILIQDRRTTLINELENLKQTEVF